jgi:hypothetical protein
LYAAWPAAGYDVAMAGPNFAVRASVARWFAIAAYAIADGTSNRPRCSLRTIYGRIDGWSATPFNPLPTSSGSRLAARHRRC